MSADGFSLASLLADGEALHDAVTALADGLELATSPRERWLADYARRDPIGARRLVVIADAVAARRAALSKPGRARDEIMRQIPAKKDRPRCFAPGRGAPCDARVVCFRDHDGRIVVGDRCAKHGGAEYRAAVLRGDLPTSERARS